MLDKIKNMVVSVGDLLLKAQHSDLVNGTWEGAQFKAKADIFAHEKLSRCLMNFMPEIPVISEENKTSWVERRPVSYWIIDPIDGTASYAHGYSGFVTQVALMKDHVPVLAAIYAPALNLLYTAIKGQGAYLNNKRMFLENVTYPPQRLIDNYPRPQGITLQAFNELHFEKYIECGSISLKICKIADGTADLFFKDIVVRDWDLAPPQLVLEEAGGILKDVNGRAVNYGGSYEQNGVLAVAHREGVGLFVNWYLSRSEKI